MKLVVISGASGSGKTTALHVLEDLDYYCIDNLPVGLLPAFAEKMRALPEDLGERVAVGIDARNPASDLHHFPQILDQLRASGVDCQILYLDADDAILLKRFSETRRKHPLSDEQRPLADAIRDERQLLAPIADRADLFTDTSHSNIHQLRDLIRSRIEAQQQSTLSILFLSFGFKHGVPMDADYMFDARCLPNPHWEPKLRAQTGCDTAVAEFLQGQNLVEQFVAQVGGFLNNWIPCFEADNRNYLTIAIGCTGGQHRSVYLAERLGQEFQQQYNNVLIRHRELAG
ncbi:MAG TPA: RNase adapter RapZ [Chromatiales bacterium]|nr:RNase adapter RapZ [Chromatiales bacterium]HEX23106.1 RNase adapter RapZ [Chromatiales bacterium]